MSPGLARARRTDCGVPVARPRLRDRVDACRPTLHPPRRPMSTDIDSHVERIARDGYTIVEYAVDQALLDALREDLERIEREEKVVPATNIFEGEKTVRIY